MNDLTFLDIVQLIVHELPSAEKRDGVFSDQTSPLPIRVRNFFKLRIQQALGSNGVPVTFVPGHASPVPAEIEKLLVRPKEHDFIASSHVIAKHLFTLTTGKHSPGLLCCISGRIKSAPFVAIIKLELQDGVRAHLKEEDGDKHFEIEIIDDLLLTKNTRVFKVALFQDDATGIDAVACDNQADSGKMLATYFLRSFLGCTLTGKPDVLTKQFLEAAGSHFNTIPDAETRSRYFAAVVAELNTKKGTVQLKRFAEEHVDDDDIAPFLAAMAEAEIPRNFQKDVTRIKSKLRRIRWDFDGGLSVSAPKEALDENTVQLKSLATGETKLELTAVLKKMTNVGR